MRNKINTSFGEKSFSLVNVVLLVLLCITTIYPFWNTLVASLSPIGTSYATINLWPEKIDFEAWKRVFNNSGLWTGFYNSVIRTVLGTAITITFTLITAYPLSKKTFPHKTFFTAMIVFTMFFSGGLIPSYLLIRNLHLMNTIWALVLPGAISAFNFTLFRNFFQSLPDSLEESAKIDGANDVQVLMQIVLPLSMPIIATITLWAIVGNWNSWFDALLYLNERSKYTLQVYLREMVIENKIEDEMVQMQVGMLPPTSESIQAAATMFATIPILIVYPFLQKFFSKGILVGSLKG